jgi:hypothetical protein
MPLALESVLVAALLAAAPTPTSTRPVAPAPAPRPPGGVEAGLEADVEFRPARLDGEPWAMAGLAGLAFLEGEGGLALRGSATRPIASPGPRTTVLGVLTLGLDLWRIDERLSPGFGVSSETTGWSLALAAVPSVRVTHEVAPRVTLFGDSGLGLAYATADSTTTARAPGLPDQKVSAGTSGLGAVLRFAGGVSYDLDARLRLSAEAGLGFHYGELRGTVTTLLVGAAWRR